MRVRAASNPLWCVTYGVSISPRYATHERFEEYCQFASDIPSAGAKSAQRADRIEYGASSRGLFMEKITPIERSPAKGNTARQPIRKLVLSLPDASYGSRLALESIIPPTDDRQPVADSDAAPWRWICALHITAQTGRHLLGTGWFLGPRTVATAGHCVFLQDEGGWAKSIDVIAALNGSSALGHVVSTRFRSVSGWVTDNNDSADYGVVLLDEELGATTGYFSFGALSDDELEGENLTVCGYPADRGAGRQQYFHTQQIARTTATSLEYENDTYGGQSGSPAWVVVNGQRVVVGIHTLGRIALNGALRISLEVFNHLCAWKRWPSQ